MKYANPRSLSPEEIFLTKSLMIWSGMTDVSLVDFEVYLKVSIIALLSRG